MIYMDSQGRESKSIQVCICLCCHWPSFKHDYVLSIYIISFMKVTSGISQRIPNQVMRWARYYTTLTILLLHL